MKLLQYSLFLGLLSFCSCLKEDERVLMPEPGDTVTRTVNMGADYKYQIWFDLGTGMAVKTSPKMDWDIAFDSDASKNNLYLNASRLMQAAKSANTFEETTVLSGLPFRPDLSEGNPDSLAFANWSVGDVYVIDLGVNEAGAPMGHLKVQITAFEGNAISIRYAKLDGSDEHIGQLSKNNDCNSVAYSFTSHQPLLTEPPKTDWDIVFTQYTYMFYDPYTPYLVTGVLINGNGVKVAVDSLKSFQDITRDDLDRYEFTNQADAIGYDWKVYDFDLSTYVIHSNVNYIIKDVEGIYYKLHFIDFYDDNGVKGNPKFEMQRL